MASKKFLRILFGVLAILATTELSAQVNDPLSGTWELNIEKSKFISFPAPKSQTRVYEVTGQHEKMIGNGINAKGNPAVQQFSGDRDGKDYPYEGGPKGATISITPVYPFTATYTVKVGKAVNHTGKRVISPDGKMMTISVKFTGQNVENLMVFDKR